jgi:isoquinoline 1-oxidoreductase alpha subunit
MQIEFQINGEDISIEADPAKPLLWVLREDLALTGTKYGCGVAACGACTVHRDGEAARCCVLPIEAVAGHAITTIEGLAAKGERHRVQQAWIDARVPQCGYCQSGMIMAAASLLAKTPNPTDAEIDAAVTNICRCGTYPRIRAAIRALSEAV